jgi:hypothetical protein
MEGDFRRDTFRPLKHDLPPRGENLTVPRKWNRAVANNDCSGLALLQQVASVSLVSLKSPPIRASMAGNRDVLELVLDCCPPHDVSYLYVPCDAFERRGVTKGSGKCLANCCRIGPIGRPAQASICVDGDWVPCTIRWGVGRAKCPRSVQAKLSSDPENLDLRGSRQSDSNRRPADYESAAIPTELCRHLRGKTYRVHEYVGPSSINIGARSLNTYNNFILK